MACGAARTMADRAAAVPRAPAEFLVVMALGGHRQLSRTPQAIEEPAST
ncbi:hypothetical protein [Streptomyces sp. NPDC058335]